jgi:hypothetical protein
MKACSGLRSRRLKTLSLELSGFWDRKKAVAFAMAFFVFWLSLAAFGINDLSGGLGDRILFKTWDGFTNTLIMISPISVTHNMPKSNIRSLRW